MKNPRCYYWRANVTKFDKAVMTRQNSDSVLCSLTSFSDHNVILKKGDVFRIIVAICADRLLSARWRISSLTYNRRNVPLAILLATIVGGTFLLTFYNHVAYDCYEYHYCNGSQVYSLCIPVTSRLYRKDDVTPHSQLFRSVIHIATVLHAILVVLIPNIVIAVLNCSLIYELKRHDRNLLLPDENGAVSRRNKERRAVITVCAIVTCFTITQGPSAWLQLWFLASKPMKLFGAHSYNMNATANCLVYIGKSLNFLLFCLSSKPYRKRLRALIEEHFRGKITQRQRPEHAEVKTDFEMDPI